jgi:hypothetical protein
MASWEAFGDMLARHGIIDPLAIEDPDGYDGFRTVGKIRSAYQELSEGTVQTKEIPAIAPASDWRVGYRKRHPLPKFTHYMGCWWADMVPIMQTTSMGQSFPIHPETPLDEVPDYVVGAYCGINRLRWGTFMMAHSQKHGGGDSWQNAEAIRPATTNPNEA